MVLGWILLWWPGRLVEAMHHAVWRKPSGELFDPSKRPEDDERDSVLFCEDSALKIDLKMPLYIPSRRLLLSGHKALANLVDLLDRELNLAREITMQARSDGAVFVSGQPLRVTLSGEAAKNMRKLQRARRLAFAQCAALSEAELNPQGSQHSDH